VKNTNYFVRAGTKLQQCTQLAGLTTQTQFTKELGGKPMPVITKPFLDVVVNNVNTKAECTFTYEVFMDETTLVAKGGPTTLNPCSYIHKSTEIPSNLPPCVHTWKLIVHTTTGDNTYTLEAAYLIADVNSDGKVDMMDIYPTIKAFGTYPSHPRWDTRCDSNNDSRVDMKDIYLVIAHFGEKL